MKIEIINGITVVSPTEKKYITNGEAYSDSRVYLGNLDFPDNWYEVDTIPDTEFNSEIYVEDDTYGN